MKEPFPEHTQDEPVKLSRPLLVQDHAHFEVRIRGPARKVGRRYQTGLHVRDYSLGMHVPLGPFGPIGDEKAGSGASLGHSLAKTRAGCSR